MAETLYKIQLRNVPERFDIDLAGTTFVFETRWNDYAKYWALDIYDADSNPLIMAIPMITGANLIEQYPQLDGFLAILTDGDDYAIPTLQSLGVESNLYYGSLELLAELILDPTALPKSFIVTVRTIPVTTEGELVYATS